MRKQSLKIKPSPAELARQLGIYTSQVYQVIGDKTSLYKALMKGLEVYCKIENKIIEPVKVKTNEELKLFCVSNGMNVKSYLLLRLAGIKKGDDLLEAKESIVNRKWARGKKFLNQ